MWFENLGILKSSKAPHQISKILLTYVRFAHTYMSKLVDENLATKNCFISGEFWLGLEALHKLTSEGSYSLHILMKDFDQKSYVAVYDQFEVIMMLRLRLRWWWYC